MLNLPIEFSDKMKELLGGEYPDYLESLERPSACGLRVNTSKISVEKFRELFDYRLRPVDWCPNGFYYDPSIDRPSAHPLYYCGLFYIQEPSAMAPASFLPVEPGDKVLDLCAAPGGKTTQLALSLQEKGLLLSNDISPSRSKALLKNVELFGLKNTIVCSEPAQNLVAYFPEFFDKILVDAPCSGEGMFRRGARMVKAWQEHGPEFFSPIQREIVTEALKMLKPGGMILYSTCTFDPSEDEEVIDYMLSVCPELRIEELPCYEGFAHGFSRYAPRAGKAIERAVRFFPHRLEGDGHFVCLMRKGDPDPLQNRELLPDYIRTDTVGKGKAAKLLKTKVPGELPEMKGIRFKRTGLLLGEEKDGELIPSQALAMTLNAQDDYPVLSLSLDDGRSVRYLKGESLEISAADGLPDKGYALVTIDSFPAGFGKIAGKRLKNKLLPGWRMQL